MGAVLSQQSDVDTLEGYIREIAKTQPLPSSTIGKEIAARYGIEFTGTIVDCFGLHEEGNKFCSVCKDRAKCLHENRRNGIKSIDITQTFISSFDNHTLVIDHSHSESRENEIDRNSLIMWLDSFESIFQRSYKNSVSYVSTFSRKLLLKIEKFKKGSYSVVYYAPPESITHQNATWNETKGVYRSRIPDIEVIKEIVQELFTSIQLFQESVNIKSLDHYRKSLIDNCLKNGFFLKEKPQTSIIMDIHRKKLISFYNFTSRSFKTSFNRKYTASMGIKNTYKSNNPSELEQLINTYIDYVKSNPIQ